MGGTPHTIMAGVEGFEPSHAVLGYMYFAGSASGSYYDEAIKNGMTEEQAKSYSGIMGLAEGATEMIGIGRLLKGGEALTKGTVKTALKEYGISVADNFIQEAIMEPIDEATKASVGAESNWSNMGNRMLESGVNGAIIAVMMGGASAGVSSSTNVLNKLQNNETVTTQEIKIAIEDTQKAGVNVEDTIKQSVLNTVNSDTVKTNLQAVENKQDSEYYKSAVKSKIDINNTTVNKIYNLTENRGIKASYNADLFTNNNHNAIWRVNKDSEGNITREVILNPNSATDEKTVQNIIVHELTHDMEGQKVDYEQLSKFALSKMKTQEGYESAFKNLKDIYSTVYDRNSDNFNTLVEQEAVADFLGENLGNQEFVNELVASQNRNFVQKIYNWVSNKVQLFGNKITGNTEAEYWRKVKYTFEKALNSEYQVNDTQSKFSINSNFKTDYDNWNKVDRSGNFLIGRTSQALQSIGLNDYDIVMDKSKILKIKNDHPEMNDDIIKSIPDILENPTLILDTQSKEKKAKGRKVVFGEVTDTTGNPVLVALELNPDENKTNINKIYKVASAYGKENLNAIQNWLNRKENILYIDEQKNRTTNWLNGLGLQLPVPYNTSSSISSIAPLNEDVNTTKYSMQEKE